MRLWRGAQIVLVAALLGAGAVVACSSFGSSGDDTPDAGLDAASTPDGNEGGGGDGGSADADAGPLLRFCATQAATALLCDDFEENDGGISTVWTKETKSATIVAADAPMRAGHAAQMTVTGTDRGNAILKFVFPALTAIAGVVFDLDILLQTAGYDYMELIELHTVGASVDWWGVAKSGNQLGMHYTPPVGIAEIMVDGAWHHVHVELVAGGDAGAGSDGSTGFHQTTTIDTTVIEDTHVDLSPVTYAEINIGVIDTIAGMGQPLAVLFYDNVLLRAK